MIWYSDGLRYLKMPPINPLLELRSTLSRSHFVSFLIMSSIFWSLSDKDLMQKWLDSVCLFKSSLHLSQCLRRYSHSNSWAFKSWCVPEILHPLFQHTFFWNKQLSWWASTSSWPKTSEQPLAAFSHLTFSLESQFTKNYEGFPYVNFEQPLGHLVSFHFQSEIQVAHADTPQLEQDIGLMSTFLQRQQRRSLMFVSLSFSSPSVLSKSMFDLTMVLALLKGTWLRPYASLGWMKVLRLITLSFSSSASS